MTRRIGLIFHGLGQPRRNLEPGEAPFWVGVDRFERVLDRILALPDPAQVRVSFDDGNLSDFDIALPRLQARGLAADVFMLSGRMGQPGSLSQGDLRALVAAGVQVGSHGIDHLNLTSLAPGDLARELSQSRSVLEQALGQAVTEFSIPFGAYNAPVLAAIRKAGYSVAWSSDRGAFFEGSFLRPRTSIRDGMTEGEIDAILLGRMGLAPRLRRSLGMLRRRFGRA